MPNPLAERVNPNNDSESTVQLVRSGLMLRQSRAQAILTDTQNMGIFQDRAMVLVNAL